MRRILQAACALPAHPRNLARMLNRNADRLGSHPVYQQRREGIYVPLTWDALQRRVRALQNHFLERGLEPGDRVAILSPNRQEMLELELAVMALGAVAVPIFSGYPPGRAAKLVRFCEPRFVAVADGDQYRKLDKPETFGLIIHFDPLPAAPNLVFFPDLVTDPPREGKILNEDLPAESTSLMMYTSGTMGKPKCVQLTHRNILSQQAAMGVLWDLGPADRFLSYLPWHHSFGGIFELFAALYNGSVLALEEGYGKDIDTLLENWKQVLPSVFFSVPRIYQGLTSRALQDPQLEAAIFHPGLRFIFTAAAPLPKNVSDQFEKRGIRVMEGWGLTETSPCCTITDPLLPREPGLVGKPIPGVTLQLDPDDEILVQGPNVMNGYFKNPRATAQALTATGWFHTGDVGRFGPGGLHLVARKDRIFKLSNAEKVVPSEIENLITKDCAFLSHAYLAGSGRDYPVTLLFPNQALIGHLPEGSRLKEGCERPRNLEDFSRCLEHCLKRLNRSLEIKYTRPRTAMLVDYELSIEKEELTPSMKLAPNVVGRVFKAHIEKLYGTGPQLRERVYVINLE